MDLKQKVLQTSATATDTGPGARGDWYQAWGGETSIGGTGSDPSSPGLFFDGDVYEVVLYEGTLSDTDRDDVFDAMASTAAIPEPTAAVLLGLAGIMLLGRRPRRA